MALKTSRGCVYNLNYHLIWVTKYRKEVFVTKELQQNMIEILQDLAKLKLIEIQVIEVMPDHVHILYSTHPKYAPSEVVKLLKGASARIWFKKHPETKKKLWGGHLWSDSYFVSSLGDMSKNVVENYINNQSKEYNAGRKRKNKRA